VEIGGGFSFTTSQSQGAALVLPSGGSSKKYRGHDDLRHTIRDHAQSWINWVREKMREPELNELRVVVGVHHAKDWALASHSSASSSGELNLKVTVSDAGISGKGRLHWETSISSEGRTCTEDQLSPDATRNQAVFVTAINIYDAEAETPRKSKVLKWFRTNKNNDQMGRGKRSEHTDRSGNNTGSMSGGASGGSSSSTTAPTDAVQCSDADPEEDISILVYICLYFFSS
jgi:hypothetical protein